MNPNNQTEMEENRAHTAEKEVLVKIACQENVIQNEEGESRENREW